MKKLSIGFLFFILFTGAYLFPSDWPTYKGNLYFTGNNDEIIVKNNSLKWLFMASNYIFYPAISDGKVYFSDFDKILYCVKEEDGKLVWKTDLKSISAHFASASAAAGKVKFPVIKGNYIFLSDSTAIYCIDKNSGRTVWARSGLQENDLHMAVIDGIYADPIISGDTIYYGTRKNFIARDISSGHVLWSNGAIQSYSGFPAYYDDKIFAASRDYTRNTYEVVCMDRYSGKTAWNAPIEIPMIIFPPVIYQEKVFIPTGKTLVCLSLSNGSKIWEKEYADYITSSPGFTDRAILMTLGNREIAVLSPDSGSVFYSLEFGERSDPMFVTVNDQLYAAFNYIKQVGGKNITFTAAKAYIFGENAPFWEFLPPFPGSVSQPAADGGTLFLPAGNYLYAVGTFYEKPLVFGNDGGLSPVKSESSSSLATGSSVSTAVSESASSISSSSSSLYMVNLDDENVGGTVNVHDIYFEFDKAYLRPESKITLDNIAGQLKKNPGIKLEIRGHTDNIGDPSYNQKLSVQRADAVMEYFIKNGISPERLRSAGFGSSKPVASNSTEEGRSKNRRTEFLILEK
jgi:outer membrane protein OmpA-like peptidoglycan-associated protein